MVMTYAHAESEGQRLVCSKDRVETSGQTQTVLLFFYLPCQLGQ